jgi:hypothetical protein
LETLNFEAMKLRLTQDGTGFVLALRVHPNQIPEPLVRDFVGARYMVAMVRINDDEEPVQYKKTRSNQAGMLCKNETFQQFLVDEGYAHKADEVSATNALYEVCGIHSRSELNGNGQKEFDQLLEDYEGYAKDTPF